MILRIFILQLLLIPGIKSIAQARVAPRIDSLFRAYLDSSLSGALLIAEQNKVTAKKAYGFSNNETKKLNTTKTLFNVASIGKHFTVYAVLLLEQQGLLNTNDYLSKYIGSFNDTRDSITLHHLLIHRSGMVDEAAEIDYSTRMNFIATIKKGKPDSIPGKKYRYSNAGFNMLAAVVEIVSGQLFEQFLQKNIFEPFKMKDTGYPWEARIKKNLLATGYNNKRQPMPVQPNVWGARGPGNLVTSMDDLYRWMLALQNDKFVSATIRNKILYDYYPGEDEYGWTKTWTNHKSRFYYKGGGRADFESRLMWYPEDKVIIIFSLNNDYNLARQIFSKIRTIMN